MGHLVKAWLINMQQIHLVIFSTLWKWIVRGSENAALYPQTTSTAFLLTDWSMSTVLSLPYTLSFLQTGFRVPWYRSRSLLLFTHHRIAPRKLCHLPPFPPPSDCRFTFCVPIWTPARGNTSHWTQSFVCTNFLKQLLTYSRFADAHVYHIRSVSCRGSWLKMPNRRWS